MLGGWLLTGVAHLLLGDSICHLRGLSKEIEIPSDWLGGGGVIATKGVLVEDIVRLV